MLDLNQDWTTLQCITATVTTASATAAPLQNNVHCQPLNSLICVLLSNKGTIVAAATSLKARQLAVVLGTAVPVGFVVIFATAR